MKKLFAVTLAVAMVLSMGAVSFAAINNKEISYIAIGDVVFKDDANITEESLYLFDGEPGESEDDFEDINDNGVWDKEPTYPGYGDTALFIISPREAGPMRAAANPKDFSSLKVSADWEKGEELVDSVTAVRRMMDGDLWGFVAVKIVDKDTTASADIYGTLEVNRSGFAKGEKASVYIKVGYETYAQGTDTLAKDNKIATFGEEGSFPAEEDTEITLYGGAGKMVVNTVGQGKILLSNTVDVSKRAEIEALYPDSNFYYLNGNGKSLNKTGLLYINAAEGSVLYSVGADGVTLKKLNAAYDKDEEAFVVKTRTLGTYVIADKELVLAEVPAPANPETGAAA